MLTDNKMLEIRSRFPTFQRKFISTVVPTENMVLLVREPANVGSDD
jgi:hypothetical protein